MEENQKDSNRKPIFEEAPSTVNVPAAAGRFPLQKAKPWLYVAGLVVLVVSGYLVYNLTVPSREPLSPLAKNAGGNSLSDQSLKGNAEPTEAGTIINPLNGLMYTEVQAKIWQSRRPMAVMVNNSVEARPQSGLSQADLVYEVNAEGGIPRLMPIFLSKTPDKVGSIRSVRVYFVDFSKEYDAWLAHWGGAQVDPNNPAVADPRADVYNRMRTIFVSSIDETKNGDGDGVFWREPKPGLAYEHTGFASVPKLYEMGYALYPDQKRDYRTIKPWLFKEDAPLSTRPESSSVGFNFWNFPQYAVRWEYDRDSNTYKRFQGGIAQMDTTTSQQLAAKDVILQIMTETAFGDEKHHLYYNTVGSGPAKVLSDGKVIAATWRHPTLEERTRYFEAATGKELSFNRGQIWIEVVPDTSVITVSP